MRKIKLPSTIKLESHMARTGWIAHGSWAFATATAFIGGMVVEELLNNREKLLKEREEKRKSGREL